MNSIITYEYIIFVLWYAAMLALVIFPLLNDKVTIERLLYSSVMSFILLIVVTIVLYYENISAVIFTGHTEGFKDCVIQGIDYIHKFVC
jgi:TctA family transporter